MLKADGPASARGDTAAVFVPHRGGGGSHGLSSPFGGPAASALPPLALGR